MAAKNLIDAFRNTFPEEKLTDENLKAKLNEKIDEVMKIIENAKKDMRIQKKKISQKKPTSDNTAETSDDAVEAMHASSPDEDKNKETTEPVETTKEEKPIENPPLSEETIEEKENPKIPKKRKISEEEMTHRKLLQRFSVILQKPLKRLFEISDFNSERIEGDDYYHEYARELLVNIQEEIYDVLMAIPDKELEKIRKLPYKEKKQKLQEIKENFEAFVDDMHSTMARIGLEKLLPDKNVYDAPKSEADEAIELKDDDILEAEPDTENIISEPETTVEEILAVNSKPAEAVKTTEEPTVKSETVSAKPAPGYSEIIKIMESDTKIHELMDKLEIIRQAFNDYDADPEALPKNIKTDLETFKKMFIKRTNNSHPLATTGSKEALAKMYIELLNQNKPELFLGWNKTAFLKEISKRLKRVYINNEKLLEE